MAAVLGGYAFALAASLLIIRLLPMAAAEATLTGNLLSFVLYTGAIIWVFSVRQPQRAWLGLMIPTGLLTVAMLLMTALAPSL